MKTTTKIFLLSASLLLAASEVSAASPKETDLERYTRIRAAHGGAEASPVAATRPQLNMTCTNFIALKTKTPVFTNTAIQLSQNQSGVYILSHRPMDNLANYRSLDVTHNLTQENEKYTVAVTTMASTTVYTLDTTQNLMTVAVVSLADFLKPTTVTSYVAACVSTPGL